MFLQKNLLVFGEYIITLCFPGDTLTYAKKLSIEYSESIFGLQNSFVFLIYSNLVSVWA